MAMLVAGTFLILTLGMHFEVMIQTQDYLRTYKEETGVMLSTSSPPNGYFNLSCPFEWSKYSCAFNQQKEHERQTDASRSYYLSQLNQIRSSISRVTGDKMKPIRVLLVGDSLMRQLFLAIACNAASVFDTNVVTHAVVPWRDEWPCHGIGRCISGGQHGGFNAASFVLADGAMEIHFVPQAGTVGESEGEPNVLNRMSHEVKNTGTISFGKKTAMTPSDPKVDVLVYMAGIHGGAAAGKERIRTFETVSVPMMKALDIPLRPKLIYVTTPTQHFHSPDGQYQSNKSFLDLGCIDNAQSPIQAVERHFLTPGANVDAIVDYDDADLGMMHIARGDCSHYCMPGVPDIVAARLLNSILD